jgi:cardiolipin synthase
MSALLMLPSTPLAEWMDWIVGAAALAWAGLSVWAAVHALTSKQDPRSALGWTLVCLFVPYVGPLIYVMFGVNRIGRHARRLGHRVPDRSASPEVDTTGHGRHEVLSGHGDFVHISDRVTHRPIVAATEVLPLMCGTEAYARMQDDIRSARRRVVLSSFIFRTDAVGLEFVRVLKSAVERGVSTWVLVDGVGELYSIPRISRALRQAGIPNARFIPVRLFPPTVHINLRNHRKLLVVDGEIAYTGGMNIGAQHVPQGDGDEAVADIHFRLTGPVVGQLEEVFQEDWCFATGEHLALPEADGEQAGHAAEGTCARVICDGPDDDVGKLEFVIVSAISAARRSVRIMTPYFIPSRGLTSALNSAAVRGVTVDIVLPARSNLRYVDWATRNLLWEVLRWDVRVWYQPPPFAHTKLFIVDDHYVHIGSANMDPRSLRLNFEIAVEVFDEAFGARLAGHVDEVIQRSRPVTLDEVDGRPFLARIRDAVAWLFSPYL